MKTPEELLITRYKVVGLYPGTTYAIGDIISDQKWMEDYPNLFENVMWWEYLPIEELPQYLINLFHEIKYVIKVVKYEPYYNEHCTTPNDAYVVYIDEKRHDPIIFFEPATEQQYNDYISSLKPKEEPEVERSVATADDRRKTDE